MQHDFSGTLHGLKNCTNLIRNTVMDSKLNHLHNSQGDAKIKNSIFTKTGLKNYNDCSEVLLIDQ